MPPFLVETSVVEGAAVLALSGELDMAGAATLQRELDAVPGGPPEAVVVDLRGVTFMDSSGLRLAIRWDAAAREQGFRFAVVPGPEVVQRVFRVTGMDAHLTVADPPPASAA